MRFWLLFILLLPTAAHILLDESLTYRARTDEGTFSGVAPQGNVDGDVIYCSVLSGQIERCAENLDKIIVENIELASNNNWRGKQGGKYTDTDY